MSMRIQLKKLAICNIKHLVFGSEFTVYYSDENVCFACVANNTNKRINIIANKVSWSWKL